MGLTPIISPRSTKGDSFGWQSGTSPERASRYGNAVKENWHTLHFATDLLILVQHFMQIMLPFSISHVSVTWSIRLSSSNDTSFLIVVKSSSMWSWRYFLKIWAKSFSNLSILSTTWYNGDFQSQLMGESSGYYCISLAGWDWMNTTFAAMPIITNKIIISDD